MSNKKSWFIRFMRNILTLKNAVILITFIFIVTITWYLSDKYTKYKKNILHEQATSKFLQVFDKYNQNNTIESKEFLSNLTNGQNYSIDTLIIMLHSVINKNIDKKMIKNIKSHYDNLQYDNFINLYYFLHDKYIDTKNNGFWYIMHTQHLMNMIFDKKFDEAIKLGNKIIKNINNGTDIRFVTTTIGLLERLKQDN